MHTKVTHKEVPEELPETVLQRVLHSGVKQVHESSGSDSQTSPKLSAQQLMEETHECSNIPKETAQSASPQNITTH